MELEITDTHGWLQYDCTLALTLDELLQLRLAFSLAKAHGVDITIVETFLAMTDNL